MRYRRWSRHAALLATLCALLAGLLLAGGQSIAAALFGISAAALFAWSRIAGRSPVARHPFSPARGGWDADLIPYELSEGVFRPLRQRDGACRHCGRDRADRVHV